MYSTDHVGLLEAFLCKNEVCNKKKKFFILSPIPLSILSSLFLPWLTSCHSELRQWASLSYCIVNYWWVESHTAGWITAVQHCIHSRAKTHEWSICAMTSLYFNRSVSEKQSTHNVWCCSSSMEIKMYMKNVYCKWKYDRGASATHNWQYHSLPWWMNRDTKQTQH